MLIYRRRLKTSSLPCKRLSLGERQGSWKIQEQTLEWESIFPGEPFFAFREQEPLSELILHIFRHSHFTTLWELGTAAPHCSGNKTDGPRCLHTSQRQRSKTLGFERSICSKTCVLFTTSCYVCRYLVKTMPGKSIKYTGSPFLWFMSHWSDPILPSPRTSSCRIFPGRIRNVYKLDNWGKKTYASFFAKVFEC